MPFVTRHRLFACFFSLCNKSHYTCDYVAAYLRRKCSKYRDSHGLLYAINRSSPAILLQLTYEENVPRIVTVTDCATFDQIQSALRWRFVATLLQRNVVPSIESATGCFTTPFRFLLEGV